MSCGIAFWVTKIWRRIILVSASQEIDCFSCENHIFKSTANNRNDFIVHTVYIWWKKNKISNVISLYHTPAHTMHSFNNGIQNFAITCYENSTGTSYFCVTEWKTTSIKPHKKIKLTLHWANQIVTSVEAIPHFWRTSNLM